jgi:tetratricopeptide (TPR) repeat protein
MKLRSLIFGLTLTIGFVGFAQETDQERECLRMRFLAGEELKINNYAGASMYYLKGEKICGTYDKANYDRLIGSLRNAISEEKDDLRKKAYTDTVISVYERAETAGVVGVESALVRAQYELNSSKPRRTVADELFQKGIQHAGMKLDEGYVALYYYNLLMSFNEAAADKKAPVKKRLITDYFILSKLASDAKMSAQTQTTLNTYLGYVVKACSDVLPELPGFIKALPQEKEAKKATVKNFIALLETKGCEESKEYEMLIDTLIAIDPNIDAVIAKAKLLRAKKRYSEAITTYRDAKGMTTDADMKEQLDYNIAEIQFLQGSYSSAYQTAMGISGKNRGEALKMAGQCVAQNANSCGSSTVERKMNYYYAVDLLERAQSAGASAGSLISRYKANYPSDGELFDNGFSKGQSVSLSCWGTNASVR